MNRLVAAVRRLLGRADIHKDCDESNPWAGLMSYSDPAAGAAALRFCGRGRETADLFYLVDNNFIVTLYGKSGIGKTSLLNAGLFPKLRAEGYHPIAIRLGLVGDNDLAGRVIEIIHNEMIRAYGSGSVEMLDIDTINADMPDSQLWRYFASHRFHDNDGRIVFPVIVFDQFEEVLRHNRAGAQALLRELSFVADPHNAISDGYVSGKPYTYDFNFRFVLSIREDDLYRLEDIVDTGYIARIKDCRYRLQNLTVEGAAQVVGDIGEPYIDGNDMGRVTELVTEAARNTEDGLINTNILSLLCSRMYQRFADTGVSAITAAMVEDFISASPFEEYYEEAVKGLSESEKRFIEDRLIDSDGRRTSVSEKEFSDNVRDAGRLFDGRRRIMQRVSAGTGSKAVGVELLHDAMCPVIIRNRATRLELKNWRIITLSLLIIGAVSYLCLDRVIIDNLVRLMLACMTGQQVVFGQVESVSLFISIVLFPIMTGMAVYGFRRPWYQAFIPVFIIVLPMLFYIGSDDTVVSQRMYGTVIAITAIALILGYSVLDDRVIAPFAGSLKKAWDTDSVKYFYIALACYMFYKSLLNERFVCDGFDSSWAIILIPLLILDITVCLLKIRYTRLPVVLYLSVLLIMAASTFFAGIAVYVELCGLIVSTVLLFIIFGCKNLPVRIVSILLNVLALMAVLGANLGYRPWLFDGMEVVRVIPWKTAVVRHNGMYGTADPFTGRMIDDALYDSIAGPALIRNITDTCYTVSDAMKVYGNPWYIVGDGKDKLLETRYFINFRQPPAGDSIIAESLNEYYRIKNATISYMINGNDSMLSRLPYDLMPLGSMLQRNLEERLQTLSDNRGDIDEPMVCGVIEALVRSLYINMLREALLKKDYAHVAELYLNYYTAVLLTDIIPYNSRISFNVRHDSELNVNGSDCSESTADMRFTTAQLADRHAAAWYNLFYTVFNRECQGHKDTYIAALESNNSTFDMVVRQSASYIMKLDQYKEQLYAMITKLRQADAVQGDIIADLKNAVDRPDSVKQAVIACAMHTLLDATSAARAVTGDVRVVMTDMSASGAEMDSLMSAIGEIALEQVDLDYRMLIQSTYNRLLAIVAGNPNNIYNGLFITLCERLYTMGAFRLYDMSDYKEAMDGIASQRVSGMYRLVVQADSLRRVQNDVIQSMKSAHDGSKAAFRSLQDRLNAIAN